MMLKVPLKKVIKPNHSVRLNIGYYDQDNEPEKRKLNVILETRLEKFDRL